jgi:hypothetical protein
VATLAARRDWQARAQDSTPISYEDETFDTGGAELRVAGWGGFWLEIERKYLIAPFQEDFNCTVQSTSAAPWFPWYVAGGGDNPPFDVTTWNQPELFRAANAGAAQGGFFVPIAEVPANCPIAATSGTSPTSQGRASPFSSASSVTATALTRATRRRASRRSGRIAMPASAEPTSPRTPCR